MAVFGRRLPSHGCRFRIGAYRFLAAEWNGSDFGLERRLGFGRKQRDFRFCQKVCGTRMPLKTYSGKSLRLRCYTAPIVANLRSFSQPNAMLVLYSINVVNAYHWFSSEEISSQNQVKASVQRKIRNSIAEEYPGLEPILDDLLPKKSPLIVVKCQNHLNLVVVNTVPLFFNIRDGPYMPTLRLLHQYPNVMKKFQVDRGAIKFVLSGANIMCPGLTSPGGHLDDEVGAESPLAIMAEGKQHALAIGFTKLSAKDIRAINKGIAIDNMHYLNDGLWKVAKLYHVFTLLHYKGEIILHVNTYRSGGWLFSGLGAPCLFCPPCISQVIEIHFINRTPYQLRFAVFQLREFQNEVLSGEIEGVSETLNWERHVSAFAHRVAGYLEEEAIHSYTEFLKELDKGTIEDVPAPAIALDYWRLLQGSTLRVSGM
ncbi:unnamed protein product [Rhodiola kirilowii]